MTRTVLFLAFPGLIDLDLAGPMQVFSTSSARIGPMDGGPAYRIVVASHGGGPIALSSGLEITTQSLDGVEAADVDTLIVPGGAREGQPVADPGVVGWLRDHASAARRVCSVCVGAFVLGEAGLLAGRAATTHWRWTAELQARHPACEVRSGPIFVRDGQVWTSAGVTTGIDLALHLVEQDHGRRIAMDVAATLAMFVRRPASQAQLSSALTLQRDCDPDFSELLGWAADNLTRDLSVSSLAERVCLSPRTFARRFVRNVGRTPADAVRALRVEAAMRLLGDGGMSAKAAMRAVGLRSERPLREAVLAASGLGSASRR
jgi:transcriptional regulator GlxA family with amidase domain